MKRLLAVCLLCLLSTGCSTGYQKTILLSENDAEECKPQFYRSARKYVHINLYSRKSLLIGVHEFPVWLELGRIVRGASVPTNRDRFLGEKPKKMWGAKIVIPYKEPTL